MACTAFNFGRKFSWAGNHVSRFNEEAGTMIRWTAEAQGVAIDYQHELMGVLTSLWTVPFRRTSAWWRTLSARKLLSCWMAVMALVVCYRRLARYRRAIIFLLRKSYFTHINDHVFPAGDRPWIWPQQNFLGAQPTLMFGIGWSV